jgi:hypothetical protein
MGTGMGTGGMGMGAENMVDLSAIITVIPAQAVFPGSILRTDLAAEHFPRGEAQVCPVLTRGAGHRQFSIAARGVRGQGQAQHIGVMEHGHLPGHVQVSMSIPVTPG